MIRHTTGRRWMSALLTLVLISCDDAPPDRSTDERLSGSAPPGQVADLAVTGDISSLFELLGEQVTVSGQVSRRASDRVFWLRADVLGFRPLLVVVPSEVAVPSGDSVRVVGVVAELDDEELADALVDVEVEPLDDRAILAEEVRAISEVEADDSVEPATTEASTMP